MSKIALEGNASGTGTFTIASPNSNSNYTLTLPTSTGTVVVTGGAQTIEFAAGTAASPSITFTGDTNTGIFSPGADTIAFSEGGTESMRIDSSGNVSIGATSSSSQAFRVSQTAFPNVPSGWYANAGDGNAEQYGITRVDATNGRGIRFQTTLDGSNLPYYSISTGTAASTIAGMTWTERMRITSAGNVGIGVSAPATILHASGSIITQGTGGNTAPTGQTVAGMYSNSAAIFISGFGTSTPNTYQPIIFQQENQVGSAERMRIDSSGNVGIGTSSPSKRLHVALNTTSDYAVVRVSNSGSTANIDMGVGGSAVGGALANNAYLYNTGNSALVFGTNDTERARITSGGSFNVGSTVTGGSESLTMYAETVHKYIWSSHNSSNTGQACYYANRANNDGDLFEFRQANTTEGTISVSGTTVSYNGGHLSRWAQTQGPKDDTLLKGTVLSNLDEMNVYVAPTTYWAEEDELPEGVSVGDVKVETHTVDNEQLNKVKVSDVEGDVNVAGVFVNWSYDEQHQVDEINMAMTGDMIIRIAQGVVVQKGDLLMSAGDGTAKPQGDDIVRSKTVAKVTSNHVTCTYEDGSYCVPCVLMAC